MVSLEHNVARKVADKRAEESSARHCYRRGGGLRVDVAYVIDLAATPPVLGHAKRSMIKALRPASSS